MILGRQLESRFILWILGAGAAAAIVLLAVSWQDLLVRYHLLALRRDPSSFVSLLDAPKGTAKELALEAFVREPAGRQAVVSRFIEDFEQARAQGSRMTWRLDSVDQAAIGFRGESRDRLGSFKFWGELEWSDDSQSTLFPSPNPYTARLSNLLAGCRGASFPQYRGLEVEILSLESVTRQWTETWTGPRPESPEDWAVRLSRPRL